MILKTGKSPGSTKRLAVPDAGGLGLAWKVAVDTVPNDKSKDPRDGMDPREDKDPKADAFEVLKKDC